jgi:hypothetical protein
VFKLSSRTGEVHHTRRPSHCPLKRICDELRPEGGLVVWIALRWYPVLLLLYAGGIAAVAGARYENLRLLLHTPTLLADAGHMLTDVGGLALALFAG